MAIPPYLIKMGLLRNDDREAGDDRVSEVKDGVEQQPGGRAYYGTNTGSPVMIG